MGDNKYTHALLTFKYVNKYRSIYRAMRRGKVNYDGYLLPKRPFANSKAASKRKNRGLIFTEIKLNIYKQYKRYELG